MEKKYKYYIEKLANGRFNLYREWECERIGISIFDPNYFVYAHECYEDKGWVFVGDSTSPFSKIFPKRAVTPISKKEAKRYVALKELVG